MNSLLLITLVYYTFCLRLFNSTWFSWSEFKRWSNCDFLIRMMLFGPSTSSLSPTFFAKGLLTPICYDLFKASLYYSSNASLNQPLISFALASSLSVDVSSSICTSFIMLVTVICALLSFSLDTNWKCYSSGFVNLPGKWVSRWRSEALPCPPPPSPALWLELEFDLAPFPAAIKPFSRIFLSWSARRLGANLARISATSYKLSGSF